MRVVSNSVASGALDSGACGCRCHGAWCDVRQPNVIVVTLTRPVADPIVID
jgi:hypothetical protein